MCLVFQALVSPLLQGGFHVPASQPAFVTNPTSVSTFAATYTVFMFNPNIMGAHSNLVEGYASLMGGGSMTPQVLPGSVMGGGGEGFIVLGQAEPVRDP